MSQQRISTGKPSAVHVSAEYQQRKSRSKAHLNYAIPEARNLVRLFAWRIVIHNM